MSTGILVCPTPSAARDMLDFLDSEEVVGSKTFELTFLINREPKQFKVMFVNDEEYKDIVLVSDLEEGASPLHAFAVETYLTNFIEADES